MSAPQQWQVTGAVDLIRVLITSDMLTDAGLHHAAEMLDRFAAQTHADGALRLTIDHLRSHIADEISMRALPRAEP